jgi:hypothetical protein
MSFNLLLGARAGLGANIAEALWRGDKVTFAY